MFLFTLEARQMSFFGFVFKETYHCPINCSFKWYGNILMSIAVDIKMFYCNKLHILKSSFLFFFR